MRSASGGAPLGCSTCQPRTVAARVRQACRRWPARLPARRTAAAPGWSRGTGPRDDDEPFPGYGRRRCCATRTATGCPVTGLSCSRTRLTNCCANRRRRTATQDIEVAGQLIREGEQVVVLLAGANRDPAQFPDPDVPDFRRPKASQHMSFGPGPHSCLGAARATGARSRSAQGDGQLVPGVRLPLSRYSLAFSSSAGIAFFSQRVTGRFIIHPIGLLNWKSRPRTTLVPPGAGSQRKYPWNLTNESVHAGTPVISILWPGMTTTSCVVLGPGRPMSFGRKWTSTPRPSGAGLIQWILPSLSSTFR